MFGPPSFKVLEQLLPEGGECILLPLNFITMNARLLLSFPKFETLTLVMVYTYRLMKNCQYFTKICLISIGM